MANSVVGNTERFMSESFSMLKVAERSCAYKIVEKTVECILILLSFSSANDGALFGS